MLSASLNKTFPSFLPSLLVVVYVTTDNIIYMKLKVDSETNLVRHCKGLIFGFGCRTREGAEHQPGRRGVSEHNLRRVGVSELSLVL